MSAELKPCPFCGAASAVLRLHDWCVKCPQCDAFGPSALSQDEAIGQWNARIEEASAEVVGFDGTERTVTLRFDFVPCVAIGELWRCEKWARKENKDEH